ncbi:cyclin-like protein [Kockiozyma suomiensis]|uniref:cyclin-like protein n=1 Tax=Kockiozyma suomiensis TaxID=1337062 RepID=UPI003343504A
MLSSSRPTSAASQHGTWPQQRQTTWIFSSQELRNSPSSRDGIDFNAESLQRAKGVMFIVQVGSQLRLAAPVIYIAAMMLHRFYTRFSMKRHHHYDIGATCIFLATKVEEHTRKLKDIVSVCCRVAQKKENLYIDEQSKEYWRWRDLILFNEELLLEALCFDFSYENPYTILATFARRFIPNERNRSPLIKSSWSFLNDSAKITLCLRYPPKALASAALYYASKITKLDVVPDPTIRDTGEGAIRNWWDDVPVSLDHIRHICSVLSDAFETSKKFPWEQKYTKQ